jgi:sugar phosphate isomerase/epimerase
MPIAVREALLSGATLEDRILQARDSGADGLELTANPALLTRLEQAANTLDRCELKVSALHAGHTHLINPSPSTRENALVSLRLAMSAAVDLGASGVVFYGHYARRAVLPDLHPYKSALELEAELLVTMLRTTLCDLAYALGTTLYLAPADPQQTSLLQKLEHGTVIIEKLDKHPHLKLAAHLHHMAMGGSHLTETLRAQAAHIGYVTLADHAGALPGFAGRSFKPIANALAETGYAGWLALDAQRDMPREALAPSVHIIRGMGFI